MERKSVPFELKDIDKAKRVAVVAHATYNSIDRTNDISKKGMFAKSWNESKSDISFYLNHDDTQAPGKVTDVYEDNNHAYTKAWLGTHTLGNDTLIMMDEGVIKNASFGYNVLQKSYSVINGKKIRELKEVQHLETSVLTRLQAHPDSKVVAVTKQLEQQLELKQLSANEVALIQKIAMSDMGVLESLMALAAITGISDDLYTWVMWQISRRAELVGNYRDQLRWDAREKNQLMEYLTTCEKFCKDTKASDDCIKSIQAEVDEIKSIISQYDTVSTGLINQPDSSRTDNDSFKKQLLLLNAKLQLQ
jgi:HK97 family phage prohead protease